MEYTVRPAQTQDIAHLHRMLCAIAALHAQERPDIFRNGTSKYSTQQLQELLQDPTYRIFTADNGERVFGYVFCVVQSVSGHQLLQDKKELYVDDLYVDPDCRGFGAATALMQRAKEEAQAIGCDCLTLNVWNFPTSACGFYEKLGYTERKRCMELAL
ncbi:MAG: GNAT family N-acetyltransferase [Clostridia bacterium]|nr:GNAT family N-acetyltransferase [Clostridia bacterium]